MRSIEKIVVHVADTPDTLDIGAAEIRQWHTDPKPRGNGWSDIGYHKVVRKGGAIEDGRPEERSGAHVAGYNSDSLAICWVGRNDCQDVQKEAMAEQIFKWLDQHNLNTDKVLGHYELAAGKTCPNLDMDQFRAWLKKKKESKDSNGTEHLPNGPSEDSIDITLEDIENQILDDE